MKATSDAIQAKPAKKKKAKSTFRRINDWLHLWLGLTSGIIVFVVCITACIWAFNEELTRLFQPEIRVKAKATPVLTPSEIQTAAGRVFPGLRVSYADYLKGRAIFVGVGNLSEPHYIVKIHPYNGEVLRIDEFGAGEKGFFPFILEGHRFLWLPYEIGRPLVNYATLVFCIILITGLIWWYPKKWNATNLRKSFLIRWNASAKRLTIDLHNVFGFYTMIFLLIMALTGVVWGLEWYNKGVFWITSAGEVLPDWKDPHSDSTRANNMTARAAMDLAWTRVVDAHPDAEGFYYRYADTTDVTSAINIIAYPSSTQFYNAQTFVFDRHTLEPLESDVIAETRYESASAAGKLRKMNFDLHVGSILGFPGKVLAFFGSLVGASLPVTGFLVWWRREFKKKKSTM